MVKITMLLAHVVMGMSSSQFRGLGDNRFGLPIQKSIFYEKGSKDRFQLILGQIYYIEIPNPNAVNGDRIYSGAWSV